ncbi:hypothetical protein KUCAC02_014277, partial [Chaenocephalus aceratus]
VLGGISQQPQYTSNPPSTSTFPDKSHREGKGEDRGVFVPPTSSSPLHHPTLFARGTLAQAAPVPESLSPVFDLLTLSFCLASPPSLPTPPELKPDPDTFTDILAYLPTAPSFPPLYILLPQHLPQ